MHSIYIRYIMDYTSLSVFLFVLITILYYVLLKPAYTLADLNSTSMLREVMANQRNMTGIYFLVVVFIQFFLNIAAMSSHCGGGQTSSIGAAAWYTFVPWIFIFGVMMVLLMTFPGLKSGFGDVIGYYAVSYSANNVLSDLLLDPEFSAQIDATEDTEEGKKSMQAAAQAVTKLMGNNSILINQVVPGNFMQFWSMLSPLMKPEYRTNQESGVVNEKKEKLLGLATRRDNIGEACWYLYTGIFLIIFGQYRISMHECDVNPDLANEKYKEYEKEQDAKEKREKTINQVEYTMN